MSASQTTSALPLSVLLCVLCLCGGCHLIFPFTIPAPGSDATAPGDGIQPVDTPVLLDLHDTASGTDLLDMAAKDQSITTSFSCTGLKPVNNMKDDSGNELELTEVALRADSGALVARRESTTDFYTAPRSTDDPTTFGPWSAWTGLAGHEDYHFYLKGGQEHALTAKKGSDGRELHDCVISSAITTCDNPLKKPILTPPSPFTSDDFDGPALATDLAVPELVFSVNEPGVGPEMIYWTVMDGSGQASLLPGSYLGAKDDDPAISPDGRVVIFSRLDGPGGLGGTDLWIVHHLPGTTTFSQPVPAPAPLNSTGNDAGPILVSVTLGGSQVLELYFSSDRNTGKSTVYRSVCTIQ